MWFVGPGWGAGAGAAGACRLGGPCAICLGGRVGAGAGEPRAASLARQDPGHGRPGAAAASIMSSLARVTLKDMHHRVTHLRGRLNFAMSQTVTFIVDAFSSITKQFDSNSAQTTTLRGPLSSDVEPSSSRRTYHSPVGLGRCRRRAVILLSGQTAQRLTRAAKARRTTVRQLVRRMAACARSCPGHESDDPRGSTSTDARAHRAVGGL